MRAVDDHGPGGEGTLVASRIRDSSDTTSRVWRVCDSGWRAGGLCASSFPAVGAGGWRRVHTGATGASRTPSPGCGGWRVHLAICRHAGEDGQDWREECPPGRGWEQGKTRGRELGSNFARAGFERVSARLRCIAFSHRPRPASAAAAGPGLARCPGARIQRAGGGELGGPQCSTWTH